jgi:hypothetical protein
MYVKDGETTAQASTEINLHLDIDGRTTFNTDMSSSVLAVDGITTIGAKRDRVDTNSEHKPSLDYSSKTTMTNLSSIPIPPHSDNSDSSVINAAYDALLFDCEIADCGMMPRTFWVPATPSQSPRCYLEKLALEIFHHHVPSNGSYKYDATTSGAEWWVQIRPSPPVTGRYSMLLSTTKSDDDKNGNDDSDYDKDGMSFHWDKDEELCKMSNGSMHIHPHISTVTYLTNLGGPTFVLSKRVDPMTGRHYVSEDVENDNDDDGKVSSSTVEGYVSWPRRGKHLSFDGRMLHGAPSNLMEEVLFERQINDIDYSEAENNDARKILIRRQRRVTFLVNVWLNYIPYGVNPFPDGMVNNLSNCDLFGDDFVMFGSNGGGKNVDNVIVDGSTPTTVTIISVHKGKGLLANHEILSADDTNNKRRKVNSCDDEIKLSKIKWALSVGDEDGIIDALIPLELIRDKGKTGSDVAINWIDGFNIDADETPKTINRLP